MLDAYPMVKTAMYCSAIMKSTHYLCACALDGLIFSERPVQAALCFSQ